MERKDIEKFLVEKKGYNENDIAEFWEDYLEIDPNFEYTEKELDVLVCDKKSRMDYREVNKLLEEVGKSELLSNKNVEEARNFLCSSRHQQSNSL